MRRLFFLCKPQRYERGQPSLHVKIVKYSSSIFIHVPPHRAPMASGLGSLKRAHSTIATGLARLALSFGTVRFHVSCALGTIQERTKTQVVFCSLFCSLNLFSINFECVTLVSSAFGHGSFPRWCLHLQ